MDLNETDGMEQVEDTTMQDASTDADSSPSEQHEDTPSYMSDETIDFIDSISEDPENEAQAQSQESNAAPNMPKTPEQEDAEILANIPSERGRERFKEVITARREAEARERDVSERLQSIQSMFQDGRMTPDLAGQYLDFNLRALSENPNDVRVARDMALEMAATLSRRLGEAAPGYDPLNDPSFSDIRQRVEMFATSPEEAYAEIQQRIRMQEMEKQLQSYRGRDQQQIAAQQEYQNAQNEVHSFSRAANDYFSSKRNDPDYPEKFALIKEKLSDNQFRERFIRDQNGNVLPPSVWLHNLGIMYESIHIPRKQREHQPIRARPSGVGRRSTEGMRPIDFMAATLDEMGI